MEEYVPKWLWKQTIYPVEEHKMSIRSQVTSFGKQLMSFGYHIDSGRAFQMILRNRNRRLLVFCEASLINGPRPPRCVQRLLSHNVYLSCFIQSAFAKNLPELVDTVSFLLCYFLSHSNINLHGLRADWEDLKNAGNSNSVHSVRSIQINQRD